MTKQAKWTPNLVIVSKKVGEVANPSLWSVGHRVPTKWAAVKERMTEIDRYFGVHLPETVLSEWCVHI